VEEKGESTGRGRDEGERRKQGKVVGETVREQAGSLAGRASRPATTPSRFVGRIRVRMESPPAIKSFEDLEEKEKPDQKIVTFHKVSECPWIPPDLFTGGEEHTLLLWGRCACPLLPLVFLTLVGDNRTGKEFRTVPRGDCFLACPKGTSPNCFPGVLAAGGPINVTDVKRGARLTWSKGMGSFL